MTTQLFSFIALTLLVPGLTIVGRPAQAQPALQVLGQTHGIIVQGGFVPQASEGSDVQRPADLYSIGPKQDDPLVGANRGLLSIGPKQDDPRPPQPEYQTKLNTTRFGSVLLNPQPLPPRNFSRGILIGL